MSKEKKCSQIKAFFFSFTPICAFFITGYGWTDNKYGEETAAVDIGILTFVNHGCNGTYSIGDVTKETELTYSGASAEGNAADDMNAYDPFVERHHPLVNYNEFVVKTLHDVEAGEELLDNYLTFTRSAELREIALELKQLCLGKDVGGVTKYESG